VVLRRQSHPYGVRPALAHGDAWERSGGDLGGADAERFPICGRNRNSFVAGRRSPGPAEVTAPIDTVFRTDRAIFRILYAATNGRQGARSDMERRRDA
jgi:hypothetical protein